MAESRAPQPFIHRGFRAEYVGSGRGIFVFRPEEDVLQPIRTIETTER
jgi:hypothetical protein